MGAGVAHGRNPTHDRDASGLRRIGMGTLHIVATPIGHLEDVTLRALRVLREADWVLAEDTRRSRILLDHYEISQKLTSLHAHNEAARTERVLAALDRLRLTQNTVVIFTSDHGYLLGHHHKFQKQHLFEEATRVPFIVSVPWMKNGHGKATKHITELVDLYPTLAELAELKAPVELQGTSLAPLLNDTQSSAWKKDRAFTISRSGGESLRTNEWRFTQWGFGDNGMELYDLKNDPGEFTNQARNPEYADVVKDMRKQLRLKRVDAGFEKNRAAIVATFKKKKNK